MSETSELRIAEALGDLRSAMERLGFPVTVLAPTTYGLPGFQFGRGADIVVDRSWPSGSPRITMTLRTPEGIVAIKASPDAKPEKANSFTLELPFVPPSLKNSKVLGRFGGKAILMDSQDHKRAKERITNLLFRALRDRELPLFGQDEVERDLVWDTQNDTVRVTWHRVAPYTGEAAIKSARKRDLVNLGAMVDDCAGRLRVKRQFVNDGFVFRDDCQIRRATEERV